MMISRFFVLLLGALAAVHFSWAQGPREGVAQEVNPVAEVGVPDRLGPQSESVKRSSLWMAVHTQHREASSEAAMSQRRLTPTERMQLRDQVRRAAGQSDASKHPLDGQLAAPGLVSAGR